MASSGNIPSNKITCSWSNYFVQYCISGDFEILVRVCLLPFVELFFTDYRYRKSLDELQKGTDKKVALLTNATKKAEVVVSTYHYYRF